jgi:hypothetical protein
VHEGVLLGVDLGDVEAAALPTIVATPWSGRHGEAVPAVVPDVSDLGVAHG